MTHPVLTMEGISKEFPGVKALSNVGFELYPGEVHALMGENGAGKSTLMKVLSGVYSPTQGKIRLKDQEVTFRNPLDAQRQGVSIIHQEFNLFSNLSAAENIFIDRPEMKDRFGRIRWSKMYEEAQRLVDSIGGGEIDVRKEVRHLGVHSQQVIEIAKALSFQADVLIMDEPSAALPENEVKKMFDVVNRLRAQGVAIVYVSHRMKEIFEIADKVTVLRDGAKIDTRMIGEVTEQSLIQMMVGKAVGQLYPVREQQQDQEVVLQVKELSLDSTHRVSFELRRGEILGLFGVPGSGTHTIAERLFGLKRGTGAISIHGAAVKINSPSEAKAKKIAYVPPDRHRQGIIKPMSIRQNLSIPILPQLSKGLVLDEARIKQMSGEYMEKLRIKAPSDGQSVDFLSGGNQQKVVIGKWLAAHPDILILEEPTRGVDVGAKAEIYSIIDQLAQEGLSILLISSEMPEVIGLSDRILVLYKGEIVHEFAHGEADQEQLLQRASHPLIEGGTL
ncbi:sugar ABC transporter ATP-binding protein [Paenibacillus radicis (ex Gao et al. 2016)]|uniref:Ribose import ATP-binding protein RbsA n=1 Tax=Paenibacillus radicis (ex Gao et al. 2016) TaxID=1737354 RepID=A0A917M153_9BACL|nr:sugar ABC transporter ATP-binding protein [Paenibacillus radicis (ex Gao et al. 2016)]GGG70677.1 ribose import ATP-binding protein RbsA [Paenibacillus radicis (ex Gao et al. 2016)]